MKDIFWFIWPVFLVCILIIFPSIVWYTVTQPTTLKLAILIMMGEPLMIYISVISTIHWLGVLEEWCII